LHIHSQKERRKKLICHVRYPQLGSEALSLFIGSVCKHYFGKQMDEYLFIHVMARVFLEGVSKEKAFSKSSAMLGQLLSTIFGLNGMP
jgi:hypothetical protein